MAAGEYLLCENCDRKAVHDPGLNMDTPSLGTLAVLCATCVENGHTLLLYSPITHEVRSTIPSHFNRQRPAPGL